MTPESGALRSDHKVRPLAQWPEADREAWEAAVRPPWFLDAGGAAGSWRPASRRSALGGYGRWLAWLAAEGVDLAAEAPQDRLTPERLRRYLEILAPGRSPVTLASVVGVLWLMVHALFPERDWTWLRLVHRHLRRQARPVRDKAARLVSAQEGLQLGLDLIREAGARLDDPSPEAAEPRARVAAARDYRDGLIIALLSQRPLRVKNLLGIEIGAQLCHLGRRVTLSFAGTETKTHEPIEHAWPPVLLAPLERYLTEIRPNLLASPAPPNRAWPGQPAGAHLWVAQGGTAFSEGGLQKALRRHTTRRFGRYINAHAFRTSVASTVVEAAPGRIDMAQALLGHARPTTTEAHYVLSDTRLALEAHHDLIASMRKSARRRRKFDLPRGSWPCVALSTPGSPPACSGPPRSRTRFACAPPVPSGKAGRWWERSPTRPSRAPPCSVRATRRCRRDAGRAGGHRSRRKPRSILPRPRACRSVPQAGPLLPGADHHPRRGRGHRDGGRVQGHHGRPLPARPLGQDLPGIGGPHPPGARHRGAALWLSRAPPSRCRR